MRVCFDTNAFIHIFTDVSAFATLRKAIERGDLVFLITTEIAFEYRKVIAGKIGGEERWRKTVRFLDLAATLNKNVILVEPRFRFAVIAADADDNKFCDCAIVGNGDFIVTYDRHFDALRRSGYKPQPITPEALAAQLT